MAGKPAQRSGSTPAEAQGASPPQAAQAASDSAAASVQERFGPLALTRLVKPDGRMLIVYARVDART
jgi:hypothetical protein